MVSGLGGGFVIVDEVDSLGVGAVAIVGADAVAALGTACGAGAWLLPVTVSGVLFCCCSLWRKIS